MQNNYKNSRIESKMKYPNSIVKSLFSFTIFVLSFSLVSAQIPTLSKVRVSYRPDGGVSITTFLREACLIGETELQCMDRIYSDNETLKDLPYDDLDPSQLPQDRKDRDKWKGEKGRGIWVDTSLVTKSEKTKELQDELDKELAKNNPSTVKVIKLQRLIEKVKDVNTNVIPPKELSKLEVKKQSLLASIVNTVTSSISSAFDGVLSSIQNGFLALKQLVTDTLKVGTPENPAGITVYDQATGEPHCLVVNNGQIQSIPGECPSSSSAESNDQQQTPDSTDTTSTTTDIQLTGPSQAPPKPAGLDPNNQTEPTLTEETTASSTEQTTEPTPEETATSTQETTATSTEQSQ